MKLLIVLLAVLLYACEAGEPQDLVPSPVESALPDTAEEKLATQADNSFCAQFPESAKSPPVVNPVLGGPCQPAKVEEPTTVIIVGPEILSWDEGNWDEEVWK